METLFEMANRIASFVRLDEIPQKFKHLKVLGRGATTICLQENEKSVLIFTRDEMKVEYLSHCLDIMAEQIDSYPSRIHHIRGVSDIPIMVLRMPLLYPLSKENIQKVKKELNLFSKFQIKPPKNFAWKDHFQEKCNQFAAEYPESLLTPFCEWIQNYNSNQYIGDFGARQFKQTANGEIIFLDPIVSKELMELYWCK